MSRRFRFAEHPAALESLTRALTVAATAATAVGTVAVAIVIAVAAFATSLAKAETPPPSQRNFVSCPIVRDTATVPCWLSEYDGELYYLGIQTDVSADFDPPYLGHQVLVEGQVTDAPRICGGIVLDPVKVSPLPELDARCREIWPAEPQYTVPFAPRPPGPSGGRLAYDPPPGAPRPPPPPLDPDAPREFVLHYDYDMLIMGRHAPQLGEILAHAEKVGAREITVTGYAGATLLSDGTVMSEPASIAAERAREVVGLLRDAGLTDVTFSVRTGPALPPPDGVDDWQTRRSVVRVSR